MKVELMMGRVFLSLGLRKHICRGSLTRHRSINLSNISLDPDRLQGRCRPLGYLANIHTRHLSRLRPSTA